MIGSGMKSQTSCMAKPPRLDFYNNSDRLPSMSDELARLKAELAEAKADLRQHMKNFEFCNQVIPHAHWVVQDAEKMLRGEPNFLAQSIQNFQNAIKVASEDSDKTELRCEARWKDEKADIAKRLGYPGLEPWAAADKAMEELNLLRQKNKPQPTGLRGEEIMRKVMAANGYTL
jgi:hypothetical protein